MAFGTGVRIPIDVDPAGAIRGIRTTERHLDGLGKSGLRSMNLLKSAGLGAAAAVGTGLAIAIGTGVREMLEFEKVAARTANVIESTGGVAGITAKHVENLANKLQELTGTEDDVIQAGENVLLTFTKIGARGGIFDRATAAANDISVAMGTDMEGAARKLGRALQDPERGLVGLTRMGITFTTAQRERIKDLAQEGKLLQAQGIILREVEKRYQGAASSEGQTTEAVQKAQRTFEEFTQTIVAKVLPALASIIEWGRENWPAFQRFFNDAFGPMIRRLQRFGEIVADMVRLIRSLLRGEWGNAWQAARRIVENTVGQIIDDLLVLPRRLLGIARQIGPTLARGIGGAARTVFDKARDIGIALINGIVQGIKDAAGRIASAVVDAIKAAGSGASGAVSGFFSSISPFDIGGIVPGDTGQAVPIVAHAGEVVLTQRQQRELGERRIMEVLRRTGGVVGGPGSRMATGGVLGPAIDFARAQVGEPYRWGGGHAYGDFSSWDCSGFASNVAARIPGYSGGIGTTYTLFPRSKPASGSEPVVFGFRSNNSHMGIRVNGVWYDAGSGGVEVGDSRWDSLRVPPGLEYLTTGGLGRTTASGDGPDPGPRGAPDRPSPRLTVAEAIKQTLRIMRGGFGAPAAATATEIAGGIIETRHRDDSLQDKRERASGEARARAAGITNPEKIAAAGDLAVLEIRRKELEDDAVDVTQAASRVRGRIRTLRTNIKKEYANLRKERNKARRQKIIDRINALRDQHAEAVTELRGLIKQAADIQADAAELGYDINVLNQTIAGMPSAAESDTGATADAGISPDAQAQIDQANERARVAARGQAISDSFLRTLFGSGSIDPGAGSVTVNINTLHPGDPQIQGEVARWVVGALGGQGSVPSSAFGMGV